MLGLGDGGAQGLPERGGALRGTPVLTMELAVEASKAGDPAAVDRIGVGRGVNELPIQLLQQLAPLFVTPISAVVLSDETPGGL